VEHPLHFLHGVLLRRRVPACSANLGAYYKIGQNRNILYSVEEQPLYIGIDPFLQDFIKLEIL
jgi:hypothetical protein